MNKPAIRIACYCLLAAASVGGLFYYSAQQRAGNGFERVDFEAGNIELQRLFDKYGQRNYSWHYEEWFIRDFFDDMRDGVFVDVGAAHYSASSNTYYLEKELGWTGIAIDAQSHWQDGYQAHRPGTKFFCYFVSDQSGTKKEVFVPDGNPFVARAHKDSIDGLRTKGFVGKDAAVKAIATEEITLNELLEREGVSRIDLLTMDIELAEPAALRGFDIKKYAPKLVCIEESEPALEFLEKYFKDNGYVKLEPWSRIDEYNAFYAPAALSKAKGP